jgi:hypothetical protein
VLKWRGLETFLPKSSHRNVPADKVPEKKAPDTERFPENGIPGRIKLLWKKGS